MINDKPNILFVCGRNRLRSPTAEVIFRNDTRFYSRSAGISSKSKHNITSNDLEWADLVLVMEGKYKSHILGKFRDLQLPQIEDLDIPDEYEFMDKDLIELIKKGTEQSLKIKFDIK